MMRGLVIVCIWIAVASALAAPQRVLGQTVPTLYGDVPPESANAPADPVILEPIRPLFPDGTVNIAQARKCGSSDVLMMSSFAGLLLMLNVAPIGRARRRT